MAAPLRILHVQHSLAPGGMENGVVNVARALQPRGFEFHVACLTRSGVFADRLPDPSLVHELHKPDGFSPRTVLRLAALVRRLRPAVLHSHNLGALIYTSLATLGGRTTPILHGEHGQPDDGAAAVRRERQRRRYFRCARCVHTVSQGLLSHLLAAGHNPDKLVAVVNGVDTARFAPGDRALARQRLGLARSAHALLIVGRLIASKQHRLLFEALANAAADDPGLVLMVVGDGGADASEVRAAAAASPVSANIRMEGFCDDPRPYYHAADLLVAPSQIEGLSNAVLEAMACGLPALLHDACGSRDAIDDGRTGWVADLSTPTRLARAISACFANPQQLASTGAAARAEVERRFSLERMASEYSDLYRTLASRRPARTGGGDFAAAPRADLR